MKRHLIWVLGLLGSTVPAADLVIALPGAANPSRRTVEYRCDGSAQTLGLPSSTFKVEYINGGENSLVVVPIFGKPLIFVNVLSGSGARYAARQYIWWEAHNQVTVSSVQEKGQSVCKTVQ